jgi:hypothetical protein
MIAIAPLPLTQELPYIAVMVAAESGAILLKNGVADAV